MSTKGQSNQYGNTNGSRGAGVPTKHINYKYAKDYNKNLAKKDFDKHKANFGVPSKESYVTNAVRFANTIDRKNCISFVDEHGSTHKYNRKTNTYAGIDKKGYIFTYFKPKEGINYYYRKKKGNSK